LRRKESKLRKGTDIGADSETEERTSERESGQAWFDPAGTAPSNAGSGGAEDGEASESGATETGRPFVVGVAGRYCAGKNAVVGVLEKMGFGQIEVDWLGHLALERCRVAIRREFGKGVIGDDGAVDRRKLGRLVFADPEARRRLESIVHPDMVDEVRRRIANAPPGGRVVVNAALLFPMGLHRFCDAVFWVYAPAPLRLLRARRRDGLSLGEAWRRMRAQRTLQPARKDVDMYTVCNVGSVNGLEKRVRRLIGRLRQRTVSRLVHGGG